MTKFFRLLLLLLVLPVLLVLAGAVKLRATFVLHVLLPGLLVSPAPLGLLLLATAAATLVQGWFTAYALLATLGLLLAVQEHRRARRIDA